MKVEIYFFKYFYVLIICFNNVKNMTKFSNFEKKLGEKIKNIQQNIVLSKKTIVKWQIFNKEKNAALTCQNWLCVN
jgi:hypothetical protein